MSAERREITFTCRRCGRKFSRPNIPHNCNTGFRKRFGKGGFSRLPKAQPEQPESDSCSGVD